MRRQALVDDHAVNGYLEGRACCTPIHTPGRSFGAGLQAILRSEIAPKYKTWGDEETQHMVQYMMSILKRSTTPDLGVRCFSRWPVSKILIPVLFVLSLVPVSEVHAELISEQGCGKVFGLLVQGDSQQDFKIDVDNLVKVLQLELNGTVLEFRPPEEGEGIVNASGEIQGMLWDLNTGMGPDDTLIVSIHTHGLDYQGSGPPAGTGNGKLKLELGYDANGHRQHSTEWRPAQDLPWDEVTAGKILINVDTCFAEAAARELASVLSRAEFSDNEILILAATSIEEVGGGEKSALKVKDYEIPAGGYFTNALTRVMRERGIADLASPSVVAAAFDEIAALATQYARDAEHAATQRYYGITPCTSP